MPSVDPVSTKVEGQNMNFGSQCARRMMMVVAASGLLLALSGCLPLIWPADSSGWTPPPDYCPYEKVRDENMKKLAARLTPGASVTLSDALDIMRVVNARSNSGCIAAAEPGRTRALALRDTFKDQIIARLVEKCSEPEKTVTPGEYLNPIEVRRDLDQLGVPGGPCKPWEK